MKRRAWSAAAIICALLVGIAACRERGRPDPRIQMAASHAREQNAGGARSPSPSVPTRLEIPPAVAEAYSGLRLKWKDSSNGREGTVEVPLGKAVPIPGSDLSVRADAFLPAFTMSADAITSTGVEEENPGARIAVLQKEQEIFAGWIFTRFPDVHPFEHPRFSLRLEGGVRRKTS